MKKAAYCESCCGSVLLIMSICPPWYNFITHSEANELDVMPFMLSNNPSSCGQKEFNQVFMINEVKRFIISSVQKVMVLTSKKETDRFII